MATKLAGKDTYFLPFNQGSNGAGNDGGKGNPANPDGYPTSYLWEYVFQKDSMMDILQKFIHLQVKEDPSVIVNKSYYTDIIGADLTDTPAAEHSGESRSTPDASE